MFVVVAVVDDGVRPKWGGVLSRDHWEGGEGAPERRSDGVDRLSRVRPEYEE